MVEAVQPYATPRTWDYANTILKGYADSHLAHMEPKGEPWSQLLHHLSGTIGYENVTFRDHSQRTLLHYLQDAAREELQETGPSSARSAVGRRSSRGIRRNRDCS